MSVQNNLQKPAFSKSVMGYAPGEVDRYVDHVSERYNSVCRENAELKRRVIALTARIDETEAKLAEVEKNSVTKKILDKSALREVFSAMEEEKKRYDCFIESIMDRLNSIVVEDSSEEICEDDEWEEALESFIEETLPDEPADTAEQFVENAEETKEETPDAYVTAQTVTSEEYLPAAEADSHNVQPDETTEAKKTPAEIAAELDFYTDDVHHDGESFDPMTLAAQITSLKRKPTLADFMNPLPSDDKKNK